MTVLGAPAALCYEESGVTKILVHVRTTGGKVKQILWNGSVWQWSDWPDARRTRSTPGGVSYVLDGKRRINIFTPSNP